MKSGRLLAWFTAKSKLGHRATEWCIPDKTFKIGRGCTFADDRLRIERCTDRLRRYDDRLRRDKMTRLRREMMTD